MNKCECYRIRTERRYFSDYDKGYAAVQGKLLPDYEDICKGVCLGTKEVDYCNCDGDRSKCDFYENVRQEARRSNATPQQALAEIEKLIDGYWGTDPVYYINSQNKEETDAAKLCCKILEVIHIAKRGESDEKDSRKHTRNARIS